MSPVRVGINGFGRIGRNLYSAAYEAGSDLDFVAINDITDERTLAHLLKYDSILGRFPGEVEERDGAIAVDGTEIKILAERDPGDLPWADLGVEVVIESTGLFTKRDDAAKIHPDIIPYDDLTEARKDLDREQIKIITRLLGTTGRRAVRDLVIALEPGADGANLVSKAVLDQIAAQYPDRALVVLGAFDDEAARTALLAAQAWGAIVYLTAAADPESIVARRPRAERSARHRSRPGPRVPWRPATRRASR